MGRYIMTKFEMRCINTQESWRSINIAPTHKIAGTIFKFIDLLYTYAITFLPFSIHNGGVKVINCSVRTQCIICTRYDTNRDNSIINNGTSIMYYFN